MFGSRNTFREYSLYELLSQSKPEHHEGIRSVWSDPGVHYLVVFGGKRLSEKAILTVGPGLDYETLEETLDLKIEGMRPVGYVKALVLENADRGNMPAPRSTAQAAAPRKEAEPAPETGPAVAKNVLEARDKDQAWQILKRKERELSEFEQELRTREQYVQESENKLSEIAQHHYETEMELDHREEQLRSWEQRLREREALLNNS